MKYYHSIILHSGSEETIVREFISYNPFSITARAKLRKLGKGLKGIKERDGTPAKCRYRDPTTGNILRLH
jgi:hypothetical protein